jgi:protein-S-isoprenylcysteine O-methyltransferase Ste14
LYARLRHLMYSGFILWIVGWVPAFGAMVSLAIGVVGVASILDWRWLEDGALRSQYGEAYRSYCQRSWF